MVLFRSYSLANQFKSSSFSRNSCMKWCICSRSPRNSLLNPLGFRSQLCSNTSIFSLTHSAFFIYPPNLWWGTLILLSSSPRPNTPALPYYLFCPERVTPERPSLWNTLTPIIMFKSRLLSKACNLPRPNKRELVHLPEASQLHLARSLEFRNSNPCSKQFLVSLWF